MSAVIDVALPVFAIMLCGWLAGRARLLGTEAAGALNTFVYWFALPPVLFLGIARNPPAEVLNIPFIATFLLALTASGLLAVLAAFLLEPRTSPVALTQHALNAGFSNTGYMGVPLFLAAFGPQGLAPAILATVLVSSVVIGVAVIAIELSLAKGEGMACALARVGRALLRNPLVMAPVLGGIVSAAGLPLPAPVQTFGDLMGSAAGPCALFAIGLFLAGQPLALGREHGRTAGIALACLLKLLVQPALAWALTRWVFPLPPFWAGACIILSALPTGALTFVVAQRYGTAVERTSTIILVSTVLSVATLSALLATLLPLPPP